MNDRTITLPLNDFNRWICFTFIHYFPAGKCLCLAKIMREYKRIQVKQTLDTKLFHSHRIGQQNSSVVIITIMKFTKHLRTILYTISSPPFFFVTRWHFDYRTLKIAIESFNLSLEFHNVQTTHTFVASVARFDSKLCINIDKATHTYIFTQSEINSYDRKKMMGNEH